MFWNKKNFTQKNKNITIIGGGITGIFTGIHLLLKKHNVTIIEQDKKNGGKLNYYKHNIPYIIYGKNAFIELLKEVNIDYSIVNNHEKYTINVKKTNEIDLIIPNNLNDLFELLNKYSLDDNKILKELYDIINSNCNNKILLEPISSLSNKQRNKYKKAINVKQLINKKYSKISIYEYVSKINSNMIKDILFSFMPNNRSMIELIEFITLYVNDDLLLLKNDLIKLLQDKYLQLGGKILFGKSVKNIVINQYKQVEKIVLEDNSHIKSDYFISAINPYNTFNLLSNKKYIDRKLLLIYEDYLNYEIDSKLYIGFSINKKINVDCINLIVNNIKINTSNINNLKFLKSNNESVIYCEISQNYNDYDYLNILVKRKHLYEENNKNIIKTIITEFNNHFKDYKLTYLNTITPLDINDYRGLIKGFIVTPKIDIIYNTGIITNLSNLIIISPILQYTGGILKSMIISKVNSYRLEDIINHEEK